MCWSLRRRRPVEYCNRTLLGTCVCTCIERCFMAAPSLHRYCLGMWQVFTVLGDGICNLSHILMTFFFWDPPPQGPAPLLAVLFCVSLCPLCSCAYSFLEFFLQDVERRRRRDDLRVEFKRVCRVQLMSCRVRRHMYDPPLSDRISNAIAIATAVQNGGLQQQ